MIMQVQISPIIELFLKVRRAGAIRTLDSDIMFVSDQTKLEKRSGLA